MRIPALAALSFSALAGAFIATAADYPLKPIRLIVPFAAGGGNDAVARTIAQRLSAGVGEQVVVGNRAGAGGGGGAEVGAETAPHGHTLLFPGVGSHALHPRVHPHPPHHPVE